MADGDYGPNNVYANVPPVGEHGEQQLPMFMRWNNDPVGNDATKLSQLNPAMQAIIGRARANNPNLNFVIGNGLRSAADQDWAKSVGWSKVGSGDGGDATVHMSGQAADLWGLDSQGRVQFDPGQQKQISLAMKTAAQQLGTPINWGGDFKSFKDAPHFELAGGATAQSSAAPSGPPVSTGAAPAQSSASPPPGTTLNSNVIDTLGRNIAGIESSGWKNPYLALGPAVPGRGQAVGKYQVMPENVPGWTLAATGQQMTPDQFRNSPQAQEAVFRDQMQRSLQLYSPADAASIWFTGKPMSVAGGKASDQLGTTNASYVSRATAGIPNASTTLNSNLIAAQNAPVSTTPGNASAGASGSPGSVAATTAAGAAGAPSGSALPGMGQQQSNQLMQGATNLEKAISGQSSDGQGGGAAEAFADAAGSASAPGDIAGQLLRRGPGAGRRSNLRPDPEQHAHPAAMGPKPGGVADLRHCGPAGPGDQPPGAAAAAAAADAAADADDDGRRHGHQSEQQSLRRLWLWVTGSRPTLGARSVLTTKLAAGRGLAQLTPMDMGNFNGARKHIVSLGRSSGRPFQTGNASFTGATIGAA